MNDGGTGSRRSAYWDQPFVLRLYLRCLYAFSAFFLTGIILDKLGAPIGMQFAIGGIAAVGALLFRMAYPDGFDVFGDIYSQAMSELAEGDYTGVPEWLVPDDAKQNKGAGEESRDEDNR